MSKLLITPLGTISPYTKGDMNCPGFLVEYNDKKVLLDCGNGITRLLDFPDALKNLSVIITHYHKDHFGDLGSIQYASFTYHNLGLINEKIKIYLPKNDIAMNKASIVSNNNSYSEYYDIDKSTSISIDDLKKLQNADFKVIYTSDIGTTNIGELEDFCKNADLIICESSLLKKHNSNSMVHLTAYDAATLAYKANAGRLLLTHFWPEEDKRQYLEEAKQVFENVEVAKEGKKIILKNYLKQ